MAGRYKPQILHKIPDCELDYTLTTFLCWISMYILFKRYGKRRNFKRFNSFEELQQEIKLGHNEKFRGNNQFYYNTETKEIEILNNRFSYFNCQEYLVASKIVAEEDLADYRMFGT